MDVGAKSFGPLGLEVGTGGTATVVYMQSRGIMGYPFAVYEWSSRVADAVAKPTAAENIERIRSVLQPKVTDLAELLKVSRQAIYDWQAGKPIVAENETRISELAKAVDLFAVEGLTGSSAALRRPLENGKNFFVLVSEGRSAEETARRLIDVVRGELRQRESLRKRLAGRKRPPREAFEEMGTPMLGEKE
jgi:hypothetical protein